MGNLLGQAQKLQQEMKKMQDRLAQEEYSIDSAGGKVKVTVNGKNEVLKLEIDPALLKDLAQSGDSAMISDMVKVAVNQALSTAQKKMSDEMGKLVPPGLAGLF